MASEGFTEVDFTCPVCFDFFINPVVLNCSHSICSDCIQAFWESKGINECPMCREISAVSDPPLNLALKNLCETFQQERSVRSSSGGGEAVCSAHYEKLKLFCLDDQQAVCLVCRDSKLHTDHSFCPIDEAVNNNKEKLKAVLEQLREKIGIFDNFKQTLDQTADINKDQTQEMEKKISKEFEELREILRNEEVARITVLREEERQKSEMIKEKTKNTSQEIISLRCVIRDVEEQMKAEDDSFLQSFKCTLERAQLSLPDPGNVSDLLINTQGYLSNLRQTVIQKIDSSSVKGPPNIRQGHSSRGPPTVRGDHAFRGGFRGDHTSKGDPSNRGNSNFRGVGHNLYEDHTNKGNSNFRGYPGFKEDPTYRGAFKGDHTSKGDPSNRGDSNFRGVGHNVYEDHTNKGNSNFRGYPGYEEKPTYFKAFKGDHTAKGGHHFKSGHSHRGDPSFRGGYNIRGNTNSRGDHRGYGSGEPRKFRGGRNDRGAHNNEGAEEFQGNS